MEWSELVAKSCRHPGMYVGRPYIDGLTTLWSGFSLGAGDGKFDRFQRWVQSRRFPASGGYPSNLSVEAIIRLVVAGETRTLTDDDDNRAVALLHELVREFDATVDDSGAKT